jgi:hypothetical protein
VLQNGHLTTSEYDYGMSFTSHQYVHDVWSKYFKVIGIAESAIYDFQDIVVLERMPDLTMAGRIRALFGKRSYI